MPLGCMLLESAPVAGHAAATPAGPLAGSSKLLGRDTHTAPAPAAAVPLHRTKRAAAQAARAVIRSVAADLRGSDNASLQHQLQMQQGADGDLHLSGVHRFSGDWQPSQRLRRESDPEAAQHPLPLDAAASDQLRMQLLLQQVSLQLQQPEGEAAPEQRQHGEQGEEQHEPEEGQQSEEVVEMLQADLSPPNGAQCCDPQQLQLPLPLPAQPPQQQEARKQQRKRQPSIRPPRTVTDTSAPAFRGGAGKRLVLPKSQYKGLAWDKVERSWRVRVSYNGRQRHIGR